MRRTGRLVRGVQAGGLAVLLAVGLAAGASAAPLRADRTSLTCAADPRGGPATWRTALRRLDALTGPRTYPFGATGGGAYARTGPTSWTSGFFPASLWLAYQHTGSPRWLDEARRYTDGLLPVAGWTGTHDLGFMIGLPVGLAIGLDPSPARQDAYRAALVTAGRSLSSRWQASVGAIQSGDYGRSWGVIIDSAMNMPLLLQAGALVGGTEGAVLRARATDHLRLLARDFVRADGSTVHRQAYDPRTGALVGPIAGQGLSTSTAWARGQAWAIAGFARGFELTGDPVLLDAARRTADYWLAHVTPGCVPAWDLAVTSDRAPRDSSAAAIAGYGLGVLGRIDPDATRRGAYATAGATGITGLTAARWVPARRGVSGLLQHQSWNVPADPREGTYSWGDAYLLLGLSEVPESGASPAASAAIRLAR